MNIDDPKPPTQLDAIALYPEGQASYFSIKELKGSQRTASGKLTCVTLFKEADFQYKYQIICTEIFALFVPKTAMGVIRGYLDHKKQRTPRTLQ